MEGIVATSYTQGDKFFIDPAKLLPLARFLFRQRDNQETVVEFRKGRGPPRGGFDGVVNFRGSGPPRGGRGCQPIGGACGGFRGRGRG